MDPEDSAITFFQNAHFDFSAAESPTWPVRLSRATMRNIHQNVTIALGLKAVFLVSTLVGITGLWPAILADTGATVIVTMNALWLLRRR
jgi:cation transport ATPase